jgi:hypothetical protein
VTPTGATSGRIASSLVSGFVLAACGSLPADSSIESERAARASAPATRYVQNLSQREVDTVLDCIEAWDNIADPHSKTRLRIAKLDRKKTLADFARWCPRFGFEPASPATVKFNTQHASDLRWLLRDYAPSDSRSYSGDGRRPPLFSGY